MEYLRKAILIVFFTYIMQSCIAVPPLPPPPLPSDTIDTTALKGKVIVIDPGHGGQYKGAIGKTGLRESEVNLGVALYLWGFLHQAGAHPVMTRTADTTVAFPHHTPLSEDLLARSKMSNDLDPDLFISIHHNSNTNNVKKNTLEVYYKLMDPGPSRELAECIMERMKNSLEAGEAQLFPGNYSVLRNTRATAILGEASYLTHRKNEKRLTLHGFLRLEAEAYFLGILDYFRKGVPGILGVMPKGEYLCQAQPEIVGWIEDDKWGKGIDPASIKLYLDGTLVKHRYDFLTGKVSYIPATPLANTRHTLRMEAKNLGGNSATPVSTFFDTSLPPFQIEVSPLITVIPPDGFSKSMITAEIVDKNLSPVRDGTLVNFTASSGTIAYPLVATRQGKAITHLSAPYTPGLAEVVAACGGVTGTCTVAFDKPERTIVEVCIRDRQGNPLGGSELIFGEEGHRCVADPLGCCFYQPDGDESLEFTAWKDGYFPSKGFLNVSGVDGIQEKLVLEPVDHALMWNKVVVLDPQPASDTPDVQSPRETARADANLTTALCLKEMLTRAGATVFLTRESDTTPTPGERVEKANEMKAQVVISLDHRKGSSYLWYYFNSVKGKLLAGYITEFVSDELSCRKLKMATGSEFILVHTSMPAVVVNLDRRTCKKLPEHEGEIAWSEAKALYQGLRSYFKLRQ